MPAYWPLWARAYIKCSYSRGRSTAPPPATCRPAPPPGSAPPPPRSSCSSSRPAAASMRWDLRCHPVLPSAGVARAVRPGCASASACREAEVGAQEARCRQLRARLPGERQRCSPGACLQGLIDLSLQQQRLQKGRHRHAIRLHPILLHATPHFARRGGRLQGQDQRAQHRVAVDGSVSPSLAAAPDMRARPAPHLWRALQRCEQGCVRHHIGLHPLAPHLCERVHGGSRVATLRQGRGGFGAARCWARSVRCGLPPGPGAAVLQVTNHSRSQAHLGTGINHG